MRYYTQGSRYAFYFTREGVVLSLVTAASGTEPDAQGVNLALRFLGGNPEVVLEGQERAAGLVSYFRGKDPARWQTGLPRHAQVAYRELWPGVDLRLRGQAGKLKYEFQVRPAARLTDIRLAYRGATGLALDGAGALLIETARGVLRDSPPVAYQEIAGARVPVESRYVLRRRSGVEREYGFAVGAGYRPDHELIIDPGLDYSTFIGGSSHDVGAGIAIDTAGNAYVVGTTYSADFPTTPGVFDRTLASSNDVFVTKLNSAGSALVYSTYLGGTPAAVPAGGADHFEFGRGIAVDAAGNAYITGQTTSGNFPTTPGAFDRTLNISTFDATDAFVTKLNASGSALVYSTFLGGTDLDDSLGIAVDGAGNAYVTGQTASRNFPTTSGAFDTSSNGSYDAFVTKLNPAGAALVFSTYLGGLDNEMSERVAVGAADTAYVMGSTRSADFPTTAGAFDTSSNGGFDLFAARLNASGSALLYSTYLGGLDVDFGDGLAIDAVGNAYVAGGTLSPDFPTTAGAFDRTLDDSEGFVSKLNAGGSGLVYSTFLGGTAGEGILAVAVDAASDAWVTGGTSSADFPTTPGGFDTSFNGGGSDVFVTQLNAGGSALVYSTFLGGTDPENGNDLALDSSEDVYVAGHTYSADYPTTPGAFDVLFNGDPGIFWGDAFVAKLAVGDVPPPPPPPAAPRLLSPANGARPRQPITFDWSDVTNAASYTMQVDDSKSFTAPLVGQQSVTSSKFTTSGLSTVRHWWRVRAVNSAGVVGAWSTVRNFTPRAAQG